VGKKERFIALLVDAWDVQRPAAGDSELVAMVIRSGRASQVVEVKV